MTMNTLEQIITEAGVTLTTTPAPRNPNMAKADKWESDHWHYTLERDSKKAEGYYSKGVGLRQYNIGAARKTGLPNTQGFKQGQIAPYFLRDQRYKAVFVPVAPTLAELLDCLASDASTIENCPTFADWCAECGYDEDSRKAERTYNTCRESAAELRELLGKALYDRLLWETERL